MRSGNNEDKNKIRKRSANSSSDRRPQRPNDPKKTRKQPSQSRNQTSQGRTQPSKSNPNSRVRMVSSDPKKTSPSTKAEMNRRRKRATKRNIRIRRRKKILGGFIAAFIIVFALVLGFVFASLKDVKPVNEQLLDKLTHQTTTIKYANGETMSTAPTLYKKTPVPLSDISPFLRKAIVSIEDERFYNHDGVDYVGLIRSVVKTVLGRTQGGSTIPMQTSKMLLTSTDQTLSRKVKDIYYALEMSKTVSKDKLLETYLNNYFVGKGMCGAEAGAMGYFDKHAKDLTLAESAMLAGVTKNPSKYAPYITARLTGDEKKSDVEDKLLFFLPSEGLAQANETEKNMYEKLYEWGLVDSDTYKQLKSGDLVVRKAINNPDAKTRQEIVLQKMRELGVITEKQYVDARNQKINIKFPESKDQVASSVESLIEYDVIDALMEQGKTREEAMNMYYNGGLIINSTIDPKIQDAIEKQYAISSNFPNDTIAPNGLNEPQSATVILDYRTGQIKGLMGGRNIKAKKTLNRAITPYQPGSTIKPLSVYTPAIDTKKVTQSTLMSDARGGYRFKENKQDNPETTTSGYGSMSLRHALALSSNTIAYKTAELLGPTYEDCIDVMMDYLRNFGITSLLDFKEENKAGMTRSDRHFNSLVLGGLTKGISPLQMAAAFGAIANGGTYIEPEVFTSITTFNGEMIVKNTPETHKVVDPDVAYVVTDMLTAVVKEGIGKNAALSTGIPVAGKTGSTNDYLDTWFVGFTPYYVGSTYIGDDAGIKKEDGTIMQRRRIEGGGSMSSARLWGKVMNDVHQNLEYKTFTKASGTYMTTINPVDGGRTSYGVLAAFLDGTAPDRYSYSGYSRNTNTNSNSTNNSNNQSGNNANSATGTNEYNQRTRYNQGTGNYSNGNRATGGTTGTSSGNTGTVTQ